MKATIAIILIMAVLNLTAFCVIAVLGIADGVSYPFPAWFRDERDICFYLGIILVCVSLPFLASSQQRDRATLSLGLSFGTVMIIAFLTSRG